MKVRVILEARYIPDHYTVCKPTGDKEYRLTRKLPIFGGKDFGVQIESESDIMFLSSENGINIIPNTQKLAIVDEVTTIAMLLQEIANPRGD